MTRFDLTSPADQKQAPLRQDGPPDESDIQTAMHQWVTAAILHADGQLSVAREEAEKYYKGEPFGNEEEGRSKIVMTELRDAVLQIMPDLLRMFFGGDPAVEYGPSTQNQIQMAEEVTKFVLDVILQQDNQGLLIYSDWFMDALIKRLGVVMCWQDKGKETRHYTLAYQTYDQMTILAADDSIEIEEVTPCEASPPGVKLYDCEYTQTRRWSRTRIQCIPPEEYLYSKGARSVSNDPFMPGVAQFVARRTELTRSQLRGMGVDEDDIEEYGFPDAELSHNTEEIERQHNQVTGDENPIAAEPNRRALWIEAYPFYDLDGDGEAELCRITMLGPAHKIVGTPEPCARRPFALICPQPTPHSIEGQAVSDWTMDLQKTVSLIWRSLLDSLVLALNPRIAYTEGEVSLEDILNVQLAAPIRTRTSPANALQVIEHNFVGAAALPVLDALKQVKKNRVGVDDASAGLDPGALQSTTAMAVAAAQSRAQAHIE
ncbi:MAG TPA: hypothetical protein VK531_12325, partial [Gemmatimonadales bacterium]|nr:hypothetical protein [Gemmatimonadales bacterium]